MSSSNITSVDDTSRLEDETQPPVAMSVITESSIQIISNYRSEHMFKPRRATPTQALQFIAQTGEKTTDPDLKRRVRQHARSYTSRSKGVEKPGPLLQVTLDVPESFGSLQSSGNPTLASSTAYLSCLKEPNLAGIGLLSRFQQIEYGGEDISYHGISTGSGSVYVQLFDDECQKHFSIFSGETST